MASNFVQYSPDLAREYGILVAILVNNIIFFSQYHNEKENKPYWHSQKELAYSFGCTYRQLRKAVEKAEESGLITTKTGLIPGTNKITTYWSVSDKCLKGYFGNDISGISEMHKRDISIYNKEPNKKLNNIQTKQIEYLILDLHKILGGTKDIKITKGRITKINARLKDFSEKEIIQSAHNLSKSEWHMGKNPNKQKYATVDFLIRSTEKIEEWLNKEIEVPPQNTNIF